MNEDFITGFEKIAGIRKALRKGGKFLGALTGVRQIRIARKQIKRRAERDRKRPRDFVNRMGKPDLMHEVKMIEREWKRLESGLRRRAVTGGIGVAAGLGTGGYLASRSKSKEVSAKEE